MTEIIKNLVMALHRSGNALTGVLRLAFESVDTSYQNNSDYSDCIILTSPIQCAIQNQNASHRLPALIQKISIYFLCIFFVCLASPFTKGAEMESIPVNLDGILLEGGEQSPITGSSEDIIYEGDSYPGLSLQLEHRDKAYNEVELHTAEPVDANRFNTLQFKAKVKTASGELPKCAIWVLNAEGSWTAGSFSEHATPLEDGWYQFSWDILHQPGSKVIDLSDIQKVRIRYDFEAIPEGEVQELSIIDMNFVAGLEELAGDPQLFNKWQEVIESYQPDYSDSSKYLLPPETGRIETPIPLAKRGKALGEIIVPEESSEPLAYASKELQDWLQKITGASFSVTKVSEEIQGTKIYLGRSFAESKFPEDIQTLSDKHAEDGFAVRVDAGTIYIFGSTDKGTLNGVYAFLENNTDIIWPRPLYELSAVYTSNPDLSIVWANALEKPVTRLRGWPGGPRLEGAVWDARNRGNFGSPEGTFVLEHAKRARMLGNYMQYGGGHNIGSYLEGNARFFPVINGKKPTQFNIWKHQPNFTAPGIVDAVAEHAIHYIEEKAPEDLQVLNINIEDNRGVSTDAKSLEPITLPDGTVLKSTDEAFRSTQYFTFLNNVTEKINAVYPNLKIGTYAYFFTATAPKIAIDSHIEILFCPYVRKDQHSPLFSPINAYWWEQATEWAQLSENVNIREYWGILNGFRPSAEVAAADIRSLLPYGIRGYTSEVADDIAWIRSGILRQSDREWDFQAQEYWVISRIYWNPSQEVEQLRKYFIRRTYREAAPEMEHFFGIIRTEYYKDKSSMGFTGSESLMKKLVIVPGHTEELQDLLKTAQSKVVHPTSKLLIDKLAQTFNTWLESAQSDESESALSVETQLQFGWLLSVDWEDEQAAWAAATVIGRNGETIHALRITLHPDRLQEKSEMTIYNQFSPGALGIHAGDTLLFNISPELSKAISDPQGLSLVAEDKNGGKIQASSNVFSKEKDGTIRVHWTLDEEALNGSEFHIEEMTKLALSIPQTILLNTEDTVLFYITDMTINRSSEKEQGIK